MSFVMSMTPSDFEDQEFIAHGGFGKVYEATIKETRVALKKLPSNQKNLRREAEMLQRANHQYVVQMLGVVDNLIEREIWIVTELMNEGSLRSYCTGPKRLNDIEKIEISINCWSALSYLHDDVKMTHKDIKPENILLHKLPYDRLVAKLCDFGLAKIKETMTVTQETSIVGTYMYYPPEYADLKRNPEKADVYSLGATLCEFLTNKHFWHYPIDLRRYENFQILFKLQEINKSSIKKWFMVNAVDYGSAAVALDQCLHFSIAIRDILKLSVSYDRHKRPSASQMLRIFQDEIKRKARELIQNKAVSELGLDCVKCYNVAITGQSGAGKSTLINYLRELNDNDLNAAPVDITECTTRMEKYVHPKNKHLVFWDCPAAGTPTHPIENYFNDKMLYAFDFLVIVFTERFKEAEATLIKNALEHEIPIVIVRNKANHSFDALKKTLEFKRHPIEEMKKKLIEGLRQDTRTALIHMDAKVVPEIFIINAWSFGDEHTPQFEEAQLKLHLAKVMKERRN